jgi:hypothetical protein
VLKKSFLGDARNFLGPLMRFARGDVRDLIVSHKIDQGPSYRRHEALHAKKSAFAEFSVLFDFRLLQQYLPQADSRTAAINSFAYRSSVRS